MSLATRYYPWALYASLTGVMWLVIVTHVIHAIAVVTDSVGTTAIVGLAYNHPGDWVPVGIGKEGLAAVYLAASLVAAYGLAHPGKAVGFHVVCWVWQQGLLLLGGISVTEAIWIGQYLDGTGSPESGIYISRQHLISDQWPFLAMAAWHFVSFWLWRLVEYVRSESDTVVAQVVRDAAGN